MFKDKIYECKEANLQDIDKAIVRLNKNKTRWARLPIEEKIKLLEEIRSRTAEIAEKWVEEACKAKSIDFNAPVANEEWLSGPFILIYTLNLYIDSLNRISKNKPSYRNNKRIRTTKSGQTILEVFPHNWVYNLLLNGVKAEIWMRPGITPDSLSENTASFYKKENPEGISTVVLGAGNIAGIPPLDILHKMIEEGQVCILKMNPVNEYLGPLFKFAFAGLIEEGFLDIVCGGSDLGAYLTTHKDLDEVHMTGSETTFNTIVFGSGAEGEKRRKANESLLKKRITAELGGVSPSIVVPGPWSKKDINFQADNLLVQKFMNAGCNCIASQLLITPNQWDLTESLLATLRTKMKGMKNRHAYYPGAAENQTALVEKYPNCETFGGHVPITLVTGLDPEKKDEYAYNEEFFGMLWGQTGISGSSPEDFLRKAVSFCNETLSGSLGANIIIHPKTRAGMGERFEDILADLKYGSIGVNIWTGGGFLLTQTSWGAYPGNTITNAGSGIGHVHNTFMFDKPEKSILYAGFYPFPRGLIHGHFNLLPKPPWFINNENGHKVAKKMTAFAAKPKLRYLPGIFYSALTG